MYHLIAYLPRTQHRVLSTQFRAFDWCHPPSVHNKTTRRLIIECRVDQSGEVFYSTHTVTHTVAPFALIPSCLRPLSQRMHTKGSMTSRWLFTSLVTCLRQRETVLEHVSLLPCYLRFRAETLVISFNTKQLNIRGPRNPHPRPPPTSAQALGLIPTRQG